MVKTISKIIDTATRIIQWIANIVIVVMMLTIAAGVVAREFFRPILGVEEIVEMLLAVLIMFSLAYAQAKDKHITIGLIVDRLPMPVQRAVDIFSYVVTALLCFMISNIFFDTAHEAYRRQEVSLLLEFPHYILKYVIAFGFLLWALEAVNSLIRLFLNWNKPAVQSEKEASF